MSYLRLTFAQVCEIIVLSCSDPMLKDEQREEGQPKLWREEHEKP